MSNNDEKKDSGTPKTPETPEPKKTVEETVPETPVVDIGDYTAGEGSDKLTHDQMLGVGGGTEFFEIINVDGTAKKHIAMPVLMRERPIVRDFLKAHAQCMIDMENLITKASDEDVKSGKIADDLGKIEERDINILLKAAYYSFKRVDPDMRDMDVNAGAEYCESWMDIKQLRRIPEIVMGINRFIPTSRTASLL